MALFSSLYLSYLFLLILFAFLFLKKSNKRTNASNLPPSPPKLPIIGNLHQLGNLPHRSLEKLSAKYGPIMLMHFGFKPTLIVSSAEIAKEIMKTHDIDFCSRPALSGPKRLSYDFQDFAFAPYGEYWRDMRKVCVLELLSAKRVKSFGFVRDQEVSNLLKLVSLSSSNPINLTERLFDLTDHITCRTAFGKSYEGRTFNVGKFHEVVYETMHMLGRFAATDFFPYFGWIIDELTGLNPKLEKCFHAFDAFYQQVIDEHLDLERVKPEHDDIIDVLLGLLNDQSTTSTRPNISLIKALLMNMFLGGVDTSAITMVWAMTELIRNPGVMKKVQDEIRTCVGKKGKVEESDIYQLEYLKMVVKETLRMHPPAVLLIPRESMNHCKINGYDIYPKTRVLVNVWAIGRSSNYWENPEQFCPERFMNKSFDFKGQDFEYLPFGAGRRSCPGSTFASAIIELGLANLLYAFNWELPNGMKKEDINMDELSGITVHKKLPLHIVPIKYNW